MEDRKIEQPIPAEVLKRMGLHPTFSSKNTDEYVSEQTCLLKNPVARAWRATVSNCKSGAPLSLVHRSFSYKIRNGKVIATVRGGKGVHLRVWDGDWVVYYDNGLVLVLPDETFHELYYITRSR